jgi:single-stranded DNA-specific DHH superfamily exonuclease
MKNIEKYNVPEDIFEYLKAMQPLKIAYHGDSDGIASCALLASMFEIVQDKNYPYTPNKFGEYKDGEIAVDCGAPPEGYTTGLVIDHHSHPDKPTYPLVLGNVPTGVTLYEVLKDHIPKERLWLVALSANGDGQPEVTPDAVWEACPELWHSSGNVYKDKMNKLKAYAYPYFAKLSSPVNAISKTGAPSKALDVVMRSDNPRELVENKIAKLAQKELNMEEYRLFNDKNNQVTVENIGNFSIIVYKSKYNLAGRLGANLTSVNRFTTYIVINEDTAEASIRGIMAKYVANKLTENGIQAGGHAGFAGISLSEVQTADDLVYTLRKILK